jgi:hypothetical protein
MKKLGIFLMGVAMVSLMFTACKKSEGGGGEEDFDNLVENGFYVVGDAAALPKLAVEGQFGPGFNEVTKAKRDGMYEKYIVLEAGKNFHFAKKQGGLVVNYGAQLKEDSLVTDYTPIFGYKGSLVENVDMQVKKTALYHIILDFDVDKALEKVGGPQIVIAEVKWGVRGGMNSWGWTAATVDPEIKAGATTLTWKWEGQELAAGGQFKFANSNAWKINLDDAEKVKAEANINATAALTGATDGGGDDHNVTVAEAGKYDISLTYTLAGGEVAKSYSIVAELKEKSSMPTTMYIIGNDFGNWSWDDPGVVEMVPVHSHPGMFWAVRYMTTDTEFKFCAVKAWNGDFTGLKTNEGFVTPGNDKVEKNGLYTIVVDLKEEKVIVSEAKLFGMGDCFGGWDEGAHAFTIADDGKASIVTAAEGNIRMYADINNPGNWWQSEFNIFDGKIVYRADGGDQEAVPVGAGKTVVLDFNAGAGEIK